ncbi:MAG: hypothetical protein WCP98_13935 [Actinomycetes bacterium]
MVIDLNREAEAVKADGVRLQGEGWLGDTSDPSQVAAYVAASERVESLSPGEVVDIVRQGLDVDVANGNSAAVRDLARDDLLKRAQA